MLLTKGRTMQVIDGLPEFVDRYDGSALLKRVLGVTLAPHTLANLNSKSRGGPPRHKLIANRARVYYRTSELLAWARGRFA